MSRNEKLAVANTIKEQIMAIDYWALAQWGANSYLGSAKNENDEGWLSFKVQNCPSVTNGTYIRITLKWDDTYTVKVHKFRKVRGSFERKETIYSETQGHHYEDLVDVINSVLVKV